MSSLVRRIEIRMMKKGGYTRNKFKIVQRADGPKLIDVRRGGVITDQNDHPIGYRWPAQIPIGAMPERKSRKRIVVKARGRRRGKHSKAWIARRQVKAAA